MTQKSERSEHSGEPEIPVTTPKEKYFDVAYWKGLREKFGIPDFGHDALIDVQYYIDKFKNDPELKGYVRQIMLRGRGDEVRIPGGGLPEVLNSYLAMLIFLTGGPPGPIGLQFIAREGEKNSEGYADSLIEDESEAVPGIINKYGNRVLFVVTGQCAAYCRYCTRSRLVGVEPAKTIDEIDTAFAYIEAHPEIKEVILSGGDVFALPRNLFEHIIERLVDFQARNILDSIRFGTRKPIQNPHGIMEWHYEGLKRLHFPNVMIHICHPSEITKQVLEVFEKFHAAGANMHSQSVLLNEINDDQQILIDLFSKIQKHGVIPYYLYQCDEVEQAGEFRVPFRRALKIWHGLRQKVSGLVGRVEFVLDVPRGFGKVIVQRGDWPGNNDIVFRDFHGDYFMFDENEDIVKIEPAEAARMLLLLGIDLDDEPNEEPDDEN